MSSEHPPAPAGIDPRGPRFAAGITALLLLAGTFLALVGSAARPGATPAERLTDHGFVLLVVIDLLFLWGFTAPRSAPWGVLFRVLMRPRLGAPSEWEDPRPPRFAQIVGFTVVSTGIVLHAVGVPYALPIAAAAAFVAAFLNAAFAFCLGCRLYLLLARAGVIRTA